MSKNKIISTRGYKCENCHMSMWVGKPIPLEIHHIDGDGNNNQDSNLQILCCNCHAFTDNYRGRGMKRTKDITDEELLSAVSKSENIRQVLLGLQLVAKGGNYDSIRKRISQLGLIDKFKKDVSCKICPSCGIEFKGNKFCSNICANRYNSNGCLTRKIARPSKDILEKMIASMGYSATGRVFGVSDNAIRKWVK